MTSLKDMTLKITKKVGVNEIQKQAELPEGREQKQISNTTAH